MKNEKMIEDKLSKIFEKQFNLQDKLYGIDNLVGNQEYINLNILACMDELSEILRETAWKNPNKIKYGWKKQQQLNEENFKEELVDLLHFYINLCISSGMEENELLQRYLNKNKENHKRKENGY